MSRRPVIHGDSVYVSQGYRKGDFYESRLLRIHLETGNPIWERLVSHVAGAPVVGENGVIYWCRWDGAILAYTPDGNLLWESETTKRNMRDPALVDSYSLVACEWAGQSEHVQLLDLATGRPRWRVNLRKTLGCHPNNFSVCQDHVAVQVSYGEFESRQEAIIGLRIADGALAWRHSLPEMTGGPFVWKGAVHFACQGRIQARSPMTGAVAGVIKASSGPPLIQGNRIVLWSNDDGGHFVAAYDDGGTEEWAVQVWRKSVSEPVIGAATSVGNSLAVLTQNGLVTMLDAATGAVQSTFVHHRGDYLTGGSAYANGRLYVAQGRLVTCYVMAQ